ncbi:hypothetical protein GS896_25755 [Rhodococcus hoagii]|nr:hypothetical protein [Prescottella equi]MBM4654088.1 hypothetical protein [Prescottella equi]MBM4719562.1 hypothetical protein [Prescottella equi]NKR23361.1 hypothetical protein [Prescottella equi]NKT56028.1 hypothetical protein [Prescottella equi]
MVSVGAVESARAAVFTEVVIREDSAAASRVRADGAAGRSDAQRSSLDRQHWSDMLAELRQALPGLPSLSLDTVVWEDVAPEKNRSGRGRPQRRGKRNTVRDAFSEGTPVARLAHRLAQRNGVDDLTPWPVKSVVNAKYLTVPVDEFPVEKPTPSSMPRLVEAMQKRARHELEVLAPALLLEKQSRVYLESEGVRVGKLLADTCRSYGVTSPGPEMTLLARNWATFYWAQAAAFAGQVLLDRDGDPDLYFADGDAAHAILAGDGQAGPWDGVPPTPSGVLLAVKDPAASPPHGALVVWRDTGSHLDIARIQVTTMRKRLRMPEVNKNMWTVVRIDRGTGVADSYGTTKGVDELARLTRMLAKAPTARGTHRAAARDDAPRPRPPVVVRYTAVPVVDDVDDRGPRSVSNLDALKWRVRGHYRRQWYPSLGIHKTIWISEHYAERGADGELVERPVVTKISQPRVIGR